MLLGSGIAMVFLLLELAIVAATVFAWVKILSKAGYSGWYVLLGLVPVVNIIAFFIFAFSQWPIEERLAVAQRSSSSAGPGGPGPYGWGGRGGGLPPFGSPTGPAAPRSWDQFSPH